MRTSIQSRRSSGLRSLTAHVLLAGLLAFAGFSCDEEDDGKSWQLVTEGQAGALLSIWGTSGSDVWTVGGDARDGTGPLVLHYDGTSWERVETGETQGNLWWVFGFANGPIYMGGDGGVILRYEDGNFTRMETPGTGTVFGIWGATADDVWAVGSATPVNGGFAWRLEGETWVDEPSLPAQVSADAAVWKVNGRSADDAWLVGSNGVSLHWDGSTLEQVDTGASTSLFTVYCNQDLVVAVGGQASGVILEYDGSNWTTIVPEFAPGLTGVVLDADSNGYAVGQFGSLYERKKGAWQAADLGFYVDYGLHATWIDSDGGVWAVGGQALSTPLTDGLIVYYGPEMSSQGL